MRKNALAVADGVSAFDRDEQFKAKRTAIITAAAHAFHELGYTETSLDEVARRLGVTKKTLYYYVKNKNALLVELFHLWLDTQEGAITRAEKSSGTPLEQLAHYTRDYVHSVLNLSAPIDRVANEVAALSEADRRSIDERRSANDSRLRKMIRAGMKSGEIREVDPKIAHYTLHGAIDWFFKYYKPQGSMTADQVVTEIMKVLFEGLRSVPTRS